MITARGLELIEAADVIVHDYLASPRLVARKKPGIPMIYVGKKSGAHSMRQEEINALLIDLAGRYRTVVRLKGGDPFIFGRGGEEALELASAGIRFEIVPGVTSGIAAPAYAGIPLTQRGVSTSTLLVTGHEDPTKSTEDKDWVTLAPTDATLVFYMGVKNTGRIAEKLIEAGRPPTTPSALIRWGTTAAQRTVTGSLDTIADAADAAGITPPAIFIVGSVVSLRDRIRWFDTLPLFGRRIVVTRSRDRKSELSFGLEVLGAEVIEVPTIEIRPPESFDELDRAIGEIASYDWVLFTSQNSVESMFDRMADTGLDTRASAGVKCAAIGDATAGALLDRGIRADLLPAKTTSEGLLEAFDDARIVLTDKRVLFPCSDRSRDVLPDGVVARGAVIDRVVAYLTAEPEETPPALDLVLQSSPDLVTFTSSSTVLNFKRLLDRVGRSELLDGLVAASIGPITTRTAEEAGIRVVAEPSEARIHSLITAIEEYFRLRGE